MEIANISKENQRLHFVVRSFSEYVFGPRLHPAEIRLRVVVLVEGSKEMGTDDVGGVISIEVCILYIASGVIDDIVVQPLRGHQTPAVTTKYFFPSIFSHNLVLVCRNFGIRLCRRCPQCP